MTYRCTTPYSNSITTPFSACPEQPLYQTTYSDAQTKANGKEYDRVDKACCYALQAMIDYVGYQDGGTGEAEVRAKRDENGGGKDHGPVDLMVGREGHEQIADKKGKHGGAKDELCRNAVDEDADACRCHDTERYQGGHLCHCAERSMLTKVHDTVWQLP